MPHPQVSSLDRLEEIVRDGEMRAADLARLLEEFVSATRALCPSCPRRMQLTPLGRWPPRKPGTGPLYWQACRSGVAFGSGWRGGLRRL
jgi:hypothetical protein